MKKALSLFLAILMMFSVLMVGSYAEDVPETTAPASSSGTDEWHRAGVLGADQVVLIFKIEGGRYSEGQYVYDMTATPPAPLYKSPDEMTMIEPYVMIPMDADSQKPGTTVALPNVDGKTGYTFVGWYCYKDGQTYAPGYTGYTIPETINGQSTAGTVINFLAVYRPTKVEEDTFAKVFDILAKIFGTLIGLIAYEGDTEAGIAFVKKVFSGISG